MAIYAIADLHLSFGVPNKSMEAFGPAWAHYAEKIETHWRETVRDDDLVLVAGDISWGMALEEAKKDLDWIGALPGTKIMIRGNHDYWWNSLAKLQKILPPKMYLIQNNALTWNGIAIGGARLWDTPEYGFSEVIEYRENPRENKEKAVPSPDETEKIFVRELLRLEASLSQLDKTASKKIAMTHYPPIGKELHASRASEILEKHKVDLCVFGHLHNVRKDALPFGKKNGVDYHLTSADYLEFRPLKLLD